MKTRGYVFPSMMFIVIIGCAPTDSPSKVPPTNAGLASPSGDQLIEVVGRTQCIPSRKGIIAPVTLHPVVEVLVAPGDRVKKDQPLVKLDDDEPQADLRGKEAVLRGARIALAEAQRFLAEMAKLHSQGGTSEQSYHSARVLALKAEQDERAAVAAVESSKAELEHYVVTAPIGGVICWLEVNPGMVSRPGTTVWGEILDLSEIDVRCELPSDQADRIAVGQSAAVQIARKETWENARVVFVGLAADKVTGRVPVLVRLSNANANLRCDVSVTVRFPDATTTGGPIPAPGSP